MYILHAAIVGESLCLWAEAPIDGDHSAAEPIVNSPRRSRARGTSIRTNQPRSADPPPTWPYDAGASGLASAVTALPGGFSPDPDRLVERTAWLPARAGQAVPSSRLLGDPPESTLPAELASWRVTALELDREEALTLLASITGERLLAPGVAVAPDLAFWAGALRFAGGLVLRQRFVPGLAVSGGEGTAAGAPRRTGRRRAGAERASYRACWEPVISGADLEAFARLTREMPPAGVALSQPGQGDSPPQWADSKTTVLRGFVSAMTDHVIRSAQWDLGILPVPVNGSGPGAVTDGGGFDSVHDQWLAALRAPDPTVAGAPAALASFRQRLVDWRRPLTTAALAPFRLCFRLEEPADDDQGNGDFFSPSSDLADWRLRFLVQATDHPSLILPLERVWDPDDEVEEAFRRRRTRPGAYLLEALGRAARISEGVAGALTRDRPSGIDLNATAAYRFLREEAPILDEAGFGVFLPGWWVRRHARARPRLRAEIQSPDMSVSSGQLSLDALVQVRWDLVLGGERLSPEEMDALVALELPLVRVRGQWVEVDADALAGLSERWRRRPDGTVRARDAIRLALGAGAGPDGEVLADVRATGWLRDLIGALTGETASDDLPPPANLDADLRPYQRRGYSWLNFLARWGFGACLADDMGLGKTVQTLAHIARDREQGDAESAPVLVVCPTSVVTNWYKEAERFTPGMKVLVHHGSDRARGERLRDVAAEHAVVVTTYPLLQRDVEDLAAVSWRGVILDEAQNIKNPDAKQARAARALRADYRIALTGTPVENHVGDLWSLMEFLNPGLLGGRTEFRRQYFLPIQTAGDPEAMDRLRRVTGPFILRRLKTDRTVIQDLPDKLETKVWCTLTREQASLYAATLRDLEGTFDDDAESRSGIERSGMILAALTRLKQVCNHPAQLLQDGSAIGRRSGKLNRLVEMLEEVLAAGERALIFTQFAEMGGLLQRHLQETFAREVLFLHGGVRKQRRDEMVARFQGDANGPEIFLLSLRAGGTGLNLTRANHVFHFDRWWNPAVESQATDRAFRIGQTRDVQVHKFVCTGTLEERIDAIIEGKSALAGRIVGAGETWLTKLSNTELRDLLALSEDAIEDAE